MNYKEAIEKVESLRKELREAEQLLYITSDGYTYKAVSLGFGPPRKHEFMNAIAFDEFIENSRDGENYIIKEFETNNPVYDTEDEGRKFSVNGIAYIVNRWYSTRRHEILCTIRKEDSRECEFECVNKTIDECIEDFMNYLT